MNKNSNRGGYKKIEVEVIADDMEAMMKMRAILDQFTEEARISILKYMLENAERDSLL